MRLLGTIELDDGERRITRLPSRAVTALLARLALWPDRLHAREELIECLWPGVDLSTGRNRFRQALSALKSQLEAPAWPAFILADRAGVRVAPGSLACDVQEFERALRAGDPASARQFYLGELMPGHYDDWIGDERLRLDALAQGMDKVPASAASRVAAGLPAPAAAALVDRLVLPSYLTRTFGTQQAVDRLRVDVLAHRLLTLIGPGGSGKTRLAVELAHALRGASPADPAEPGFDLIAFASLVACTDVSQLLAALSAALRLPDATGATVDGLVQALAGRRALIVLDNFEQLVDTAAPWIGGLLSQLPLLHLLVTSRRALALDGERELPLTPLVLPPLPASLAQAADNPAVALFVDRARAVRADFHLGPRNLAAIIDLVHALEGMPLSIELAASRVRALSPQQIAAVLQAARAAAKGETPTLDLLERSGPRSGHDARHASMRRTIEWSWQQLDADQQALLAGLTVFAADFDALAAAALDDPSAPRPQPKALPLDELAARSLLRSVGGDDAVRRFVLYEPVREFAASTLDAVRARQLRSRLRRWLAQWASAQGRATRPALFDPLRQDILASLRTAVADGEPEAALDLALALRPYWESDGLPLASVIDLEQALAAVVAQPSATAPSGRGADSHELLAYLRFGAGFVDEATAHARAALAQAGDDPRRRARAMVRLAWTQLASHREGPALEAPLREALVLAEAGGDLDTQARALHQLAIVARYHGDGVLRAEALLARAQALWERLGDRRKAYARLLNRAQCWHAIGRAAQALDSLRQCEEAARADGDAVGMLDASLALGAALAAGREWEQAAWANTRCIDLSWQRHHAHGLGYALWNQARVLARLRQAEDAGRLMAFAQQFWTQRFGPLDQDDALYLRRVDALVRAQLGPARSMTVATEGRAMGLAQAVAMARREPAGEASQGDRPATTPLSFMIRGTAPDHGRLPH